MAGKYSIGKFSKFGGLQKYGRVQKIWQILNQ